VLCKSPTGSCAEHRDVNEASVSESFLFAADSMQGTRQCVPSTGIDQANLK